MSIELVMLNISFFATSFSFGLYFFPSIRVFSSEFTLSQVAKVLELQQQSFQ